MNKITIPFPDDWHCHFRDGPVLERTVADTAHRFARAIVMPNLKPPVTQIEQAAQYRQRILQYVPANGHFTPLMTLYLTEQTTPELIANAKQCGFIYAVKLYPAGATTHSAAGVKELKPLYPVFEAMQTHGLPLLIHGESIDPEVDIFDRESVFIDKQLAPLIHDFPKLKVVLEHISTQTAVEFILAAPNQVAATITPHHLYFNRNQLFQGGICPHYYCLPILKRQTDQQALINAATSGNPKFFLGTDSAPHAQAKKETACGCAGIYSAHAAIEMYAEIFAKQHALDNLAAFASINGAHFYGLPINRNTLTLVKQDWQIANALPYGKEKLIPMLAGKTLTWKIITS